MPTVAARFGQSSPPPAPSEKAFSTECATTCELSPKATPMFAGSFDLYRMTLSRCLPILMRTSSIESRRIVEFTDQPNQFNQADKYPHSPYGLLAPPAAAELHHLMGHYLPMRHFLEIFLIPQSAKAIIRDRTSKNSPNLLEGRHCWLNSSPPESQNPQGTPPLMSKRFRYLSDFPNRRRPAFRLTRSRPNLASFAQRCRKEPTWTLSNT